MQRLVFPQRYRCGLIEARIVVTVTPNLRAFPQRYRCGLIEAAARVQVSAASPAISAAISLRPH